YAQMGPALSDARGVRPDRRTNGAPGDAGPGVRGWAPDRGRAQLHRSGGAVRALLGLPGRQALSPFRTVLLSGDRRGDCARLATGRGRGPGRTQARARLRTRADPVDALHCRRRLPRRGGGLPRTGTRRNRAGPDDPWRHGAVPEGLGRAAIVVAEPFAGTALGFGDFARGHVVGYVGPAQRRFLVS